MSEQATPADSVDLGDVDPNGSRQLGRRSAVCRAGDAVVAGLDDGTVVAFEADTLDERWRKAESATGSVVAMTAFDGGVLVGERGADGDVHLLDGDTGETRWRYRTADDVGDPQQDSRFFLPFVADAIATDEAAYVACRRYERGPDGERTFRSVVYAFDPDGEVRWRHETDASPISLDARDDRVAVAFNRCPGDDRDGVRVLDADDGSVRRRWDPPGDGQRRAGDVALLADGLVVASHADYRGYRLDGKGVPANSMSGGSSEHRSDGVRWAVDLGRPVERDGETVYAYPNHVHATDAGAAFVTGNTYPEEGRETDARHPREHTAVGVAPDGTVRWQHETGGFPHEIAADGDRIAVPVAQHFRERDPSVHGVVEFDVKRGHLARIRTAGVATAAALAPGDAGASSGTCDPAVAAAEKLLVATVEEPVAYHDGDRTLGAYRLRVGRS